MKNIVIIAIVLGIIGGLPTKTHAATWNGRIFDVKTGAEMTEQEYVRDLSTYSIVVLGEKHYTPAVQAAEARTIENVVQATGKAGAFTTGWEFLNFSSQDQTDSLFGELKTGKIDAASFLNTTQGYAPSIAYAPVLETTAKLDGKLLGLNLSRDEKTPIVEKGIGALDPKLLPPGFDYGTAGYFERFKEIMQNHSTPAQLQNYYAAQCVTDDVMAYHILNNSADQLRFIIAGSFHTEYFDGAVHRIHVRAPETKMVAVRIFDASDLPESELMSVLHDPAYGDIADYVYFVNEPASP